MMTTLILVGVIVLLIFWVISIYNRLITFRNQVKNAWSQIDVQLQRRYDLIPNLVEAVKGYMGFEKSTLDAVIKARSQAVAARNDLVQKGGPTEGSIQQLASAESALKSSLGNIFALAENYPQLRASENMMQLQEELNATENKVAFSRQAYNDQVLQYNTFQQQFPAAIFAGLFGHHPAEVYETENTEAKKAIKISFS